MTSRRSLACLAALSSSAGKSDAALSLLCVDLLADIRSYIAEVGPWVPCYLRLAAPIWPPYRTTRGHVEHSSHHNCRTPCRTRGASRRLTGRVGGPRQVVPHSRRTRDRQDEARGADFCGSSRRGRKRVVGTMLGWSTWAMIWASRTNRSPPAPCGPSGTAAP